MTHEAAMLVRITVRDEGGFFYATSPDLVGLHVGGETEDQACQSALAAVKALFHHNRNISVHVMPLAKDLEPKDFELASMKGVVVQRTPL